MLIIENFYILIQRCRTFFEIFISHPCPRYYIFYYFTENEETGVQKMFTFDHYVGDIDELKIGGYSYNDVKNTGCELDPILHQEILQRAVELAKVAWTQTGQDNTNAVLAAGQRSE